MTCRLTLQGRRVKVAGPLDVPVYPAEESRPDFAIPLRPLSRTLSALRSVFAGAEGWTRRMLVCLAVLVAARFAVVSSLRLWLDCAIGVTAFYLVTRLAASGWFRARQREFEPRWLDAQSKVLASTFFEVVRLGVQEPPEPRTGAVRFRTYDLARGGDVADLLRRQAADRDAARTSQVRVEFAYSRGPARHRALETVRLDLADLPIVGSEGARRGRIRFPLARYHAQPRVAGRNRELASRTTFWVLGSGVLSAVPPQDAAPRSPIASSGVESDL